MMVERMDESPDINWNRQGSGWVCVRFVFRLGKITPVLIAPNVPMSGSSQILNRSSERLWFIFGINAAPGPFGRLPISRLFQIGSGHEFIDPFFRSSKTSKA
jgi:hypothetical protein